jgi:hypothetical protein
MSRQLLCETCGAKYEQGVHCLYEATPDEPAEWARVVKGLAKTPTREQMTIWVNGVPEQLDPAAYLCDLCGESVGPGEPAVALTIWLGGTEQPAVWERDYVGTI